MHRNLMPANALAIFVPAALLAGAYAFQYVGGLHPCEMCWWQRYAHFVAVAIGLAALLMARTALWRGLIALAALAMVASGGFGIYHAGVEQKWWQGATACTAAPTTGSTAQILADVMATPLIRCDAIPWSFAGISMAGWNAIFSLLAATTILWLIAKRR